MDNVPDTDRNLAYEQAKYYNPPIEMAEWVDNHEDGLLERFIELHDVWPLSLPAVKDWTPKIQAMWDRFLELAWADECERRAGYLD